MDKFKHLTDSELSSLRGKVAINQYIEAFIDNILPNLRLDTRELKFEAGALLSKLRQSERELLTKYTGYGGKLQESTANHGGEIYEFYTPAYLCQLMYDLAAHHGFTGGKVLEPSCGNGNMLKPFSAITKITAFEINPYSAKIAKILYDATVYPYEFERAFLDGNMWNKRIKKEVTWLKNYPFDLIIGNPPYGLHRGYYSAFFSKNYKRVEFFFIQKSINLLAENGLLVFLVPSLFMMNEDKYNAAKREIAQQAELIDAYRVGSVFSGTRLMGDVLIFKKSKKHDAEETYRLLAADTFIKENPHKSAGVWVNTNKSRDGAFYREMKVSQEDVESMIGRELGNKNVQVENHTQKNDSDKNKITESMTVQEILQKCTVEGDIVRLPGMQLDRNVYLEVSQKLEHIGGKWNGKHKGFLFPQNPADLLAQIAGGENRNLKKEFQFFATPDSLADRLVSLANIKPFDRVLEPSAGQGAIIKAINRRFPKLMVSCYELMDINREFLKKIPTAFLLGDDFLTAKIEQEYDVIIANPPFSKNQDIEHIRKMWEVLADNGTLVTVASNHWRTSSNRKEKEFAEFLKEKNAEIIDVEAGTFKESKTNIPTCIIIFQKTEVSESFETKPISILQTSRNAVIELPKSEKFSQDYGREKEAETEKKTEETPEEPVISAAATIRKNAERNGIETVFAEKPNEVIRKWLKDNDYFWHRERKIWYAKYTDAKMLAAKQFFSQNNEQAAENITEAQDSEAMPIVSQQKKGNNLFDFEDLPKEDEKQPETKKHFSKDYETANLAAIFLFPEHEKYLKNGAFFEIWFENELHKFSFKWYDNGSETANYYHFVNGDLLPNKHSLRFKSFTKKDTILSAFTAARDSFEAYIDGNFFKLRKLKKNIKIRLIAARQAMEGEKVDDVQAFPELYDFIQEGETKIQYVHIIQQGILYRFEIENEKSDVDHDKNYKVRVFKNGGVSMERNAEHLSAAHETLKNWYKYKIRA